MTKVFGKPQIRKRISVRMPEGMITDIKDTLIKLNLSIRYRSQWISECLVNLLQSKNYVDSIQEEWIALGSNKVIQITLEQVAEEALKVITEEMRAIITDKQELHSSVVRTAIIHELMRTENK